MEVLVVGGHGRLIAGPGLASWLGWSPPVARADDTPEVVEGRLRDYQDKTRPVLDLFRAEEVVVAVDATGPVEQVQAAIREQLGVEMSSV